MISHRFCEDDSYDNINGWIDNPKKEVNTDLLLLHPLITVIDIMVNLNEIGQEKTDGMFIEKLVKILQCVEIFLVKMAVWIVIGDTRHRHGKLMMSHRLALKLIEKGSYTLRDILWYK
jgi:hypothetical protein